LIKKIPEPNLGETLVRVNLAGICGTDLEIIQGYMKYDGILGHEFVGTVEKSSNSELVGKRVVGEINAGCRKCNYCEKGMERHCPNRTVLGILKRNGAFAEFLSLPEKNLHVIPDSVSDEQAVFVEPLAAAFEIGEQVSLQPQWGVAVVGDGRLAQLIIQVLKVKCSNITCFGRHKNKLQSLVNGGTKIKIGIDSSDE
jgi:threonine dehydrogenase-like Zn-dependent dehydrogenase